MSALTIATPTEIEGIAKLSRDAKAAAATLSEREARYLVDTYYQIQDQRIRAAGQIRSMEQSEEHEPHQTLEWVLKQNQTLERYIKAILDVYSKSSELGLWSRSVKGIGPVLAAGLLAHIDIERAPTVGHIWSFAGLNPDKVWGKGQKRPHNASLKTLCWKIGESFVKISGSDEESAMYGHAYKERKEFEIANNDAGKLADQAAAKLEKFKIGKTTEAYKWYSAGKLPPAHLHARAKRYAVKLFLSHWHHVAYEIRYGEAPPKPYILTQEGGHAHMIEPPNWSHCR